MAGECRHAYLLKAHPGAIVPARVHGELLDCGNYPALRPGGEAWVYGQLVELGNPAAWADLDKEENIQGGWFQRVQIDVYLSGGSVQRAWAYVGGTALESARGRIESGDWRRR